MARSLTRAHPRPHGLWLASVACVLGSLSACSGSPRIDIGGESDASVAGSGGAGGQGGAGGSGGPGGQAGNGNALTARITEPPSAMLIEVVVIGCDGECKTVLAIGDGGNPPYAFTWNDGVTGAEREVCMGDASQLSVEIADTPFEDPEFGYEGQRATASISVQALSCPSDGGVQDASCADGGMPVTSLPSTAVVAVNGPDATAAPAPSWFANGETLPAGRYRLHYVDGCLMYTFALGWTVSAPDPSGVWVVTGADNTRVVKATPNSLTFPVFQDCVNAHLQAPPVDFDFAGGRLGVWLVDSPYIDNVPGEGGRNPTYRLEQLCAD